MNWHNLTNRILLRSQYWTLVCINFFYWFVLGNTLVKVWKHCVSIFSLVSLFPSICSLYSIILLFRLLQTLALGQLMKYYMSDKNEISTEEAYAYTTAIAVLSIGTTFVGHNYILNIFHLGMKTRIAICSLIYRKSLRLSNQALSTITVGHLVNLLSNDVNRFEMAIIFMQTLIFSPVWICLLLYIIYAYVGLVACLGIATFVVYIPLQCKYYVQARTSISIFPKSFMYFCSVQFYVYWPIKGVFLCYSHLVTIFTLTHCFVHFSLISRAIYPSTSIPF